MFCRLLRFKSVWLPCSISLPHRHAELRDIGCDFCFAEPLFRLGVSSEMSEYQNVVGGRLKLKGKPLDVKEGGVKKKKKKHRRDP